MECMRPQLEVTKEYNNIIHLNIFLQTSDILPGQALVRVSHKKRFPSIATLKLET